MLNLYLVFTIKSFNIIANNSSRVELILSLLIYYYSVLIASSFNIVLRRLRSLALLIFLKILKLVYLKVSLLLKCSLKLISRVAIELLEVILEAMGDLGQAV